MCVFASAYLHDNSCAADVVQEAFSKLWNHRTDFDNFSKLKSFLYTVVRNDCLNLIRNRKMKQEDLSVLESAGFYRDHLLEEEAYRIFYEAVEELPNKSRQVIQYALDGMKNAEIAERMHITENTVHTLKKNAYKRLKQNLKDYFYLLFLYFPF